MYSLDNTAQLYDYDNNTSINKSKIVNNEDDDLIIEVHQPKSLHESRLVHFNWTDPKSIIIVS